MLRLLLNDIDTSWRMAGTSSRYAEELIGRSEGAYIDFPFRI